RPPPAGAGVGRGGGGGDLAPGPPLPRGRGPPARLGVSPGTVAAAYRTLRQRGIVETAGRRGTRIRARPPVAAVRAARRLPPPSGATDLSSGEPDPRLLPDLAPHLRRLARHRVPAAGYADAGPVPELVALARDRLAADGVPVAGAPGARHRRARGGGDRPLPPPPPPRPAG